MSNDKVIKNPARNQQENYSAYEAQYKKLGIEPISGHTSTVYPTNQPITIAKPSADNPRLPRPSIRQPYAEIPQSEIDIGALPNVGNSYEQIWSSVGGEITDDLTKLDPSKFIDNNDYLTDQELGIKTSNAVDKKTLFNILNELSDNDFLVIVNGVPLCSGSSNYIEEQTRLLVFGEHPDYPNQSFSLENLIVVKRNKIKIGVFLD
jgi:hypothetical protein